MKAYQSRPGEKLRAKQYREEKREHLKALRKAAKLADPEKAKVQEKNWRLRSTFGITLADFERMRMEQDNKCAICGASSRYRALDVDHCHKTGKVRQLLCSACNAGIGQFGDDIDKMQLAVNYLRKHLDSLAQGATQ